MITLLTKDGSQVGNAIIYGGDDGFNDNAIQMMISTTNFEPKPIFYVETDFGNHMKLTWREIEERFTIGKVMDYNQWKSERDGLRSSPNLIEERTKQHDYFR